ncbi:transposable element Tcb2 transposase [Trichonephila clavipes]|nr:transposable element Tcb2 transposase [Trichonephila clavipes]
MDDNARPHRTLAVEELPESEDIIRMDWPAYSPYLNPIEHVWDALGRRIAARLHHPENTQLLKQRLSDEWVLLPQERLHQLVLSMRRRCEATIAIVRVHYFVRGGFVGYRSRASSKHLSSHLPVDELDSSGVKKGLRCSCRCTCGGRVHKESRLDVDVFEK